jgi:PAS domain S-box-containing protein
MLRKIRAFLRRTSIPQRIILGMVFLVLITVLLISLPAVGASWRQLEQQVWLRVQNSQSATQALYHAERTRLINITALIAKRPTLCALLQSGDEQSMRSYLANIQKDAEIDLLLVVDSRGNSYSAAQTNFPSANTLIADRELPFSDFISLNDPPNVPPRLLIVAADKVRPPDTCHLEVDSWLIVAREINREFMRTLAANTGMAQSIIIGKRRVAVSLNEMLSWPLDLDATERVIRTQTTCCTFASAEGEDYYVGLAPLIDANGHVVAVSETALSGREIRRRVIYIVALLIGIGMTVALVGSILAMILTRLITRPLFSLAEAAKRIDSGDLETPIFYDYGVPEIDQLARQLDRARRDLRQTLQITQREMKHMERLLSAVREGVIAIDENERITYFSPDAESILGYRALDVLQRHYMQVFRPAPGEAFTLRELLQTPQSATSPQHIMILDAHDQPVTLAVLVSWLNNQSATGYPRERVVVLRDVSEEEAVNRLRCNFLANVAHEFRTPLSGIIATTEMLVENSANLTTDELTDLANMIRLSISHMQMLVDNLLESAAMDAGCFRLRPRPIRLQDALDNAATLVAPLLKRRAQELHVNSSDETLTLWADPERLAQVIVNLLMNASKFGPTGSPITVSVEPGFNSVTLAVLDCGPGLPAERYSELFNRFVTGDQPSGAQYGIGLGLSVVKAIVEAHGGQVGAENRAEGGARVWFTLPLKPQDEHGADHDQNPRC